INSLCQNLKDCDPLTNKFGTIHRTLTEPMLADIEFWTTKGNLSM
ncbi:20144_t:CDS:1, partial [Gigaspora margarita]